MVQAGIATLLLDVTKGFLAVWLMGHFSGENIRFMMAAGIAAVLGHVFPVWLGFSGGKGMATALGVFLAICAPAVAVAVALFLLVFVCSGVTFRSRRYRPPQRCPCWSTCSMRPGTRPRSRSRPARFLRQSWSS